MDPLTPNDPLWKVLGQAKSVEPRPNFTQNVVRLARQTPQERGLWARIKGWWLESDSARIGLTWTTVAAVVAISALAVYQPNAESISMKNLASTPAVESVSHEADYPMIPEFETEWQNLEQVGDLLAVHDTSLLTDSEINLLLY